MLSDEWLPRYRLLENFTAKWNGNGNAYDRGDYNSSFALLAVELKNEAADQLCGNPTADQRLCFSFINVDRTIPLLPKSEISRL